MKKLLLILTSVMLLAASCSSDNGGNVTDETINAKWNVIGTSEYQSFEFNKSGNYIVVKKLTTLSPEEENNQVIIFGTYQKANNVITLSDFGEITISDITTSSISFNLILYAEYHGIGIAITATKQAEMANSTKTDLLCRTWEVITINDESVVGTHDEGVTVLFSRAGTYFVNRPNDPEDAGGLVSWKWKDNNEVVMLYSWDNWGTSGGDNGEASVLELSKDKFVLWEQDREDENESETYVLRPISASASINQANGINTRKGFIK
jgi:hypothetical protein